MRETIPGQSRTPPFRWIGIRGAEKRGRYGRSCNRILFEQSGDHRRVEIGANSHDQSVPEINYPAIAIVEAHAVLRRCQRMKFDYRIVVLNDQILHMKLRALRKDLSQLGESAFDKRSLAKVVSSERMGPFHNPVHVVGHMFEERGAVAVFKPLKDFANPVGCNCHLNLSFLLRFVFVIWLLQFFRLPSMTMSSCWLPGLNRAVSSSPSPGCFP